MKKLAIVPAYNESDNIYNVVKSILLSNPSVDVLVVDDGSSDNTYDEAIKAGAKVIKLPYNLGIGGAVQTGYLYALYNSYDIAVQIDGDGQHNPKDLNNLVEQLLKENLDMVIGSRFIDKTSFKSSTMRNIGIKYFSFVVSHLCKKGFYDTTSGYRVINKKAIKLFAEYYPKDYPEVETILYANRKGLKINEVPVNMSRRKGGKSSITPVKSIYYMIKVTLALVLQPKLKEVI